MIDDGIIEKISRTASLTATKNFNLNRIIHLEKNYINEISY